MRGNVTRMRILDSANELIRRFGMNGISYSHISSQVNLRKASIHYFFRTKEDLLQELVTFQSELFLASVQEVLDAHRGDPGTKLRRYLQLFEDAFEKDGGGSICLFGMLGAELHSLNATTASLVSNFYKRNTELVAQLIQELGRGHKAEESFELARLVFATVEGAMIVSRAGNDVRSFRSTIESMLKWLELE